MTPCFGEHVPRPRAQIRPYARRDSVGARRRRDRMRRLEGCAERKVTEASAVEATLPEMWHPHGTDQKRGELLQTMRHRAPGYRCSMRSAWSPRDRGGPMLALPAGVPCLSEGLRQVWPIA